MNVNISILACLQLITVHEEFPVKFFIQFIEDQTSLGGNQCTVRIGITLITDVTDRLTLRIHIIHHVNEIQLIISVVAIALGNCRIHTFQGAFHNIMHLLDLDLILPERSCMFLCETANKILLLL